jgi:hypothetical protein
VTAHLSAQPGQESERPEHHRHTPRCHVLMSSSLRCRTAIMWALVGLGIPLFQAMAAELRIRHRGYGCEGTASPSTLMQPLHTRIALVLHACTPQGWQDMSALFGFPKSMSDVDRDNCLLVRSAQPRFLLLFSPAMSKRVTGSTAAGTLPGY